ncbi:uncharacterized protein LOC132701279 [Cylas formicarius]|uniref:uncharacterized protein LOC132701279 n=1 Tax=Cylas formicarius TaxID=197179 RepID=UPI0029588B98|nr:uncharacterized protein LOC132701279 [Cylas formicarius]
MSPITLFITTLLASHGAFAWVGLIKRDPSTPDADGYCYSGMYELGSFEKSETKRIGDLCAVATCQEDRDILLSGCAPIQARPPCYVMPGILSKPFPDCCYEIKCVNEKDVKDNSIDTETS